MRAPQCGQSTVGMTASLPPGGPAVIRAAYGTRSGEATDRAVRSLAMADLGPRELLDEWQRLMESVVSSAASLAGRSDVPKQIVESMKQQLELLRAIVEGEGELRRELAGQLAAPFDAMFDLLEQSGAAMRGQAEALQAAGRALDETAALIERQAELFEATIGALRQPAEFARSAAGLSRREDRVD